MTFICYCVSGNAHNPGSPAEFQMEMSADVPADSLTARFPLRQTFPELARVEMIRDGSVVFNGMIDEQIVSTDASGTFLTISARSFAALLLDNEAVPAVYNKPSFTEIFMVHAAPYGFKGIYGFGKCPAEFAVTKGMCEWDVIDSFCRSVMGTAPRITSDGYIDARKPEPGTPLIISNDSDKAKRFRSASLKRKRYGVISEILYKLRADGGYIYRAANADAAGRGILRRRLINLSGQADWMNRYAIESRMTGSQKGNLEITVHIPEFVSANLGDTANFCDKKIGVFTGLEICEITILWDRRGKRSVLTLRPHETDPVTA